MSKVDFEIRSSQVLEVGTQQYIGEHPCLEEQTKIRREKSRAARDKDWGAAAISQECLDPEPLTEVGTDQ